MIINCRKHVSRSGTVSVQVEVNQFLYLTAMAKRCVGVIGARQLVVLGPRTQRYMILKYTPSYRFIRDEPKPFLMH